MVEVKEKVALVLLVGVAGPAVMVVLGAGAGAANAGVFPSAGARTAETMTTMTRHMALPPTSPPLRFLPINRLPFNFTRPCIPQSPVADLSGRHTHLRVPTVPPSDSRTSHGPLTGKTALH